MDTTLGTGQTSLAITRAISDSTDKTFYISKWISPELDMTAIAANTWTWNFAIKASGTVFDYPSNTVDERVPITCYVWRPGTGTKVGNIVDAGKGSASIGNNYYDVGNNSSDPGTPNSFECAENGTFTGSAVASVQTGDVIVIEAWAYIDTANTNSRTFSFFYDGNVITTTNGPTVTDHAAFLETPETLVFAGAPPPSTGRSFHSYTDTGFWPATSSITF
jgi:hypothetical protein